MKTKKLPQFLQPFLWSARLADLDLEKNKVYIIHQILADGDLKSLRWLFKTYPASTIKKVFLNKPLRIYRPSALNFVTKILLRLRKGLNPGQYISLQVRQLQTQCYRA